MKTLRSSIAALTALAITSSLSAHEHATGVVKERMDAMESMAKSLKAMTQRVRANRDLGAIKSDAEKIRALASKITPLFPPGSTQPPTDAKLEIWKNWSDFEEKAKALEAESGKLAALDASDAKVMNTQVRAVSHTCGGCHELYRVPKH